MAILTLILAIALPGLGATTWPAGTNVANTFFQTNRFLKNVTFGNPATNIISDGGSKINGVGFTNGVITGDGSGLTGVGVPNALTNLDSRAWTNSIGDLYVGETPNIGSLFLWNDADGEWREITTVSGGFINLVANISVGTNIISRNGAFYGNGLGLTNIQGSNIVGTITVSQLNVGTLILTNPPALDLSSSTNFNGSGLFYKTNVSTAAPNFFLPYSLFSTNAAFAFLAPLNVSATNAQTAVVMVTNSTGSSVVVTAPANVHTQGTWNVTNVSTFTFFNYGGVFTNAIAFPLW